MRVKALGQAARRAYSFSQLGFLLEQLIFARAAACRVALGQLGGCAGAGAVQSRCSADSFGELFRVPRPGCGQAQGRPAARYRRTRPGDHYRRQAKRERVVQAYHPRRSGGADAAGGFRPGVDVKRHRDTSRVDFTGRQVGESLGVHPAQAANNSLGEKFRLAKRRD